jgi:hypothetical protein
MKVKRGDIFTIQLSNQQVCVGQILQASKDDIYIVAFDGSYNTPVSEKEIDHAINQIPAVLSRTGTTFFSLKRWVKISHKAPDDKSDYYPNYKIETLDGVFITTFDRQPIRKANKDEEEFYQFHDYKSPAYVVGAIEAYHGIKPMDEGYLKMTYEFIRKRANAMN